MVARPRVTRTASTATATDDVVIWQFDAPPGDTLQVSVDMQVQGGRHWGRSGTVTLLDDAGAALGITGDALIARIARLKEIGAITRRVYERRAPAPLFHNIRDSLPGARVLGAPAGLRADRARAHSRLALHFGLPEHSGPRDIVAMLRAAMRAEPIAPRRLERGPVQENVWLGEQVDLTRFPVPLLHEQDGGRYFGTYGFHVVQTPDGSWDSWSVGRLMLVDRNTLAGPTIPTQHIGIIREQGDRLAQMVDKLLALAAVWVLAQRSFLGFQVRVLGLDRRAAGFVGFREKRLVWFVLLFSGALAGLAGVCEVAGPIGQLVPQVSPGYGYAAITVAFLGRLNPFGILCASLLMALLYLGGEAAQMSLNLPLALTGLFQGMMLFFLLACDVLILYRPRLHGRWRKRPALRDALA